MQRSVLDGVSDENGNFLVYNKFKQRAYGTIECSSVNGPFAITI